MRSVKHFIEQSWLMMTAAFLCGLLLALTNAALEPRIQRNEIGEMYDKMKGLMPQADDFEKVIPQAEIAGNETDVYEALGTSNQVLGFSFVGPGYGFADQIKLVIAVNADASMLLGFDVLFSNETPGFGSRISEEPWFGQQFVDAPAETLELGPFSEGTVVVTVVIPCPATPGAALARQEVAALQQGSHGVPTIDVEGYVKGELLGGIEIQFPLEEWRHYLPVVMRNG